MEKSHSWKNILAAVSAVLFSITLSLSLVAYNIEQRIFDPEIYKQVLTDQQVCEQFPMIVSKQVISSAQSVGSSNLLVGLISSVKPESLESLLRTILPCNVVESVVFNGIDQVFTYINNATDQNVLTLDSFKESLKTNSGTAIDEYMNSLPDCSAATLLKMGAEALLGQSNADSISLCNPPDALKDIFKVPLQLAIESAFQVVPDQFSFSQSLTDLFGLLRSIRLFMNISFLLPLFFLGLTTALVVRSWRNLLQWWGYPLLVGGTVTFILSLAVAPMVYASLSYLILPRLPITLVPEAVQLISNVLSGVTQGLAMPIQVQSAILGTAGLGMVLGEKLTRKKM